jgi:hypothetical protein
VRNRELVEAAQASVQRLAKWRGHFAGWLLGTRSIDDPQAQWARDTAEKLLVMRAELNAITGLLIKHGVFDAEEFTIKLGAEAEALMRALEGRWPGITAHDDGLHYDLETIRRHDTLKGFLP